jgi:hypothetical protein
MKRVGRFAVVVVAAWIGLGSWLTADDSEGWKPLMDGKTLKGWHPVGEGEWTVEDGAFVGRANKTKLYGLLVSDDMYGDCTVRFKFRCLTGDSGFYVRTVIKEPDQAHGPQVQVGLAGSGAGGIYESYGRGWMQKPTVEQEKEILRTDDWNEMTISARDGKFVVHINGVKTADVHDTQIRDRGHFALQMHSGNVMHVMFKDIQFKE